MRIAVVDDDPAQLDLVEAVVKAMGHDCHAFADGGSLLLAIERETYDLFIVDWELPDTTGPAIVRTVRNKATLPVPILMMTNRSDERDIVEGLACGADDYMVKSSRVIEMRARLMALLRRGGHMRPASELAWGRFRFHAEQRIAWVDDTEVMLRNKEFDLALVLFRNLGRLLSRAHLIESVWGRGADISSRSLDVYISHVRSKLRLRAESGYRLVSVYNHGYRLEDVAAMPDTATPSPAAAAAMPL
jgi:DNA-binding response OmpR family regulator